MRSLGEKTPFLAFPEAKKGVVNYARLRKAAHCPNNNAKKEFFRMVPERLNAFGTFVHAAEGAN